MNIERLANAILDERERVPRSRSLLVGISGIDGGGKGYVTAKLADHLNRREAKAVTINIDGWLNLPSIRFDPRDPARNFYENGFRFEEMFERLVLPLKNTRSVKLAAELARETAAEFHYHIYDYTDAGIILLEGIFLFKAVFRGHFDLKIWIDCTFETALNRAIQRSQEGLRPDDTVKAYRTIYFPAQLIHFAGDDPRSNADLVYNNDRLISPPENQNEHPLDTCNPGRR